MNIEKIALENYNLYYLKTNKFVSNELSIKFITKLTTKALTTHNLLSEILVHSNKKYPTKRSLNIKLTDLYETYIWSNVCIKGDNLITDISISMIDDKVINENIFNKAIELFFDTIYKPNIKNSAFNVEVFNILKEELLTDLENVKENPRMYASKLVLNYMYRDKKYSNFNQGDIEELKKITPKNLYLEYKKMITKESVDVFYSGNIEKEKIIEVLNKYLKVSNKNKYIESDYIEKHKARKAPKIIDIKDDVKQTQLVLGLRIDNCTKNERDFIITYYSNILGGGTTSKLFTNVRERNSLAYYSFSRALAHNEIVLLSSGIELKNYKKTLKIIKHELNDMKQNITDEEFNIAKKNIINEFIELEDSSRTFIQTIYGMEKLGYSKEDFIKKISSVTKDEIYQLASKIYIDVVLLYHGGPNE